MRRDIPHETRHLSTPMRAFLCLACSALMALSGLPAAPALATPAAEPATAAETPAEPPEAPEPPAAPAARLVEKGVELTWDAPAEGIDSYIVYKSQAKDAEMESIGTLAANKTSFLDESIVPGAKYWYALCAASSAGTSALSASTAFTVAAMYAPTSVKASKKSGSKTLSASWGAALNSDGYQIRYAANVLFRSSKTLTVKGAQLKANIGGLAASTSYFACVRSYKVYGTTTYYSSWTYPSSVTGTRKLSIAVSKRTVTVKKKGKKKKVKKTFELRSAAKQKLRRYDTVEGSCSDGAYGYYILYNRNNEKCKIAKVKLSGMKVKKVSKVLALGHGNDMTYNGNAGYIVVVNRTVHKRRVALVNPSTLKVIRYIDISFTKYAIPGLSATLAKQISAICNIAYDASSRTYIARAVGINRYMVLNENFVPVGAIKPDVALSQMMQGLEVCGDYLLVAESAKKSGQWNRITVYDRSGRYITRMNLRGSKELESIYFAGGKLYASYYDSTSKVKKVKGKKIYVLNRRNYIYRVKGY